MKTVTVTIGRNIGTTPMDSMAWGDFQHSILEALEAMRGVSFIDTHTGTGEWDGVKEDSFKATAFFPLGNMQTRARLSEDVAQLRKDLAMIRGEFEQDAIALNLGESELI